MRRWRRSISAVLAAVACALYVSAQTTCPPGIDAPSVMTLVASPTSPETEAFVVRSDCSFRRITLMDGLLSIALAIERIDSIPSGTTEFSCIGCPLSAGFDLSAATGQVSSVDIRDASATAFTNSIFPRSVESMSIDSIPVESLDMITWPTGLDSLILTTMPRLRTLTKVPSTLSYLSVSDTQLTSIDFTVPPSLTYMSLSSSPITVLRQEHLSPVLERLNFIDCRLTSFPRLSWPSSLTELDLSGNPFTELDKAILPPRIQFFSCQRCGITLIRGVKLPSSLMSLLLVGCKVTEFEIQFSDVAVVQKLPESSLSFDPSYINDKCSDSTAQLKRFSRFRVCVISDDRFRQRYGDGVGSLDGSLGSTTSSGSNSVSTSTSSSSDASRPSNDRDGGDNNNVSGGSAANPDDPATGSRASGANTADSSTATRAAVTVIVVVVSVGVAAALALIGLRFVARRRRDGDKDFQAMRTSLNATGTTANGSHPSSGASSGNWKRDIRWDPTVASYRIDLRLLKIGKAIARGGFGVVYKAEYNDRVVAIKRLSPEVWEDEAKVYGFMDEIRMCAMLKHPKIVTFIGVAWSSQRDISVVIEMMEGGDLYALLQQQPSPSLPQDWLEPWTATKTIKSKALIARDVVEALVYLHSFNSPILHRDLKARNVLLDTQGNAKLSDFGISRELTLDETMTSEVGTVAWIAPEVLRGDRYSEKADIYSLGVLLVELDRCRHPYAGVVMDGGGSTNESISGTGLEFKDARIAMLVGGGRLRPAVSADSPSSVRELVERCLHLKPEDRPSAAEVLVYLQQFGQAYTEGIDG